MLFTVFTPTYNRAYTLEKLYISLKDQQFKDFEWLIIDDGSTDETEKLIESFILENKIAIRYYKQQNSGKHVAINMALEKAKGELFFIVDSDDKLSLDALSIIKKYYVHIENKSDIAGVVGLRYHSDGKIIGTTFQGGEIICSNFDYRYKYKVRGDKAEVFKTEILKRYPFPEIERENFIAEGIVWNRIANSYKLLYTNEKIYECEYLEDGLSNASVKNRMKNPRGACLLYKELSTFQVPLDIKLKAVTNYWRFRFCAKTDFTTNLKNINVAISILVLPLAYLIHLNDKRKWKLNIQ